MKAQKLVGLALAVLMIGAFAATVQAAPTQEDVDFYKGKLVTYIVATKPGGGYDAYGRLVGRYLQKYLPGSTVIIKNVPGAGHIIGANEIYLSKPDGLTIGTFNTGLIYSQIVGQEGIKFDLTKYSWIGKASAETRVLLAGLKTPYKSIKDILESKDPIKMPASGIGSQDYNETSILAVALPAKFQVIPGYAGNEGEMAILRGECQAVIGSYTGLTGFIKGKECVVLLQFGNETKLPELADVPHISELNVSPKGKSLISLVNNIDMIGRLTAAPPGVPAGRLEVLRDAYKKAVTDPELLQEGAKLGLAFDPKYGDVVQKMIYEAIHQPEDNLKMLKDIIKIE
jgi:tripartite-type tricarboxylate transporter receptor subunit TctC